MACLRRKADAQLERWHEDVNRLPLLIKVARQVGKTETVRRFACQHYDSLVEINFVEAPKFKKIVADGYGANEIVSTISRTGVRFGVEVWSADWIQNLFKLALFTSE